MKLKDMIQNVAKEIKGTTDSVDIKKMPDTKAPREDMTAKGYVLPSEVTGNDEASRILDTAFLVKSMRQAMGKDLTDTDKYTIEAKLRNVLKAPSLTSDITVLIPDNLTAVMHKDIVAKTNLTSLVPYKSISNPGITEAVNLNGMNSYMIAENTDATESNESYTDVIYLVKKIFTATSATYEAVNDSLFDLAAEKRAEMVRAQAFAIERAILSGDNTATHMDADVTTATDPKRAFRGFRMLAKNKHTVDFTGAALTDANLMAKIQELQVSGGNYTSQDEIGMGNVVLVVDQYLYNRLARMTTFVNANEGGASTLANGRKVASVFGIPVVTSSFLSAYDATGVVHATPGNNTLSVCVLVNLNTLKYYTVGAPILEMDKNMSKQLFQWYLSTRSGFHSIYDQSSAAPTTVDATRHNLIYGINIAR